MTKETTFLRGGLGSSSITWDLTLGTNLKFYTSVAKRFKLKVKKFWGLIPKFVEITGEKLVEGVLFGSPILNKVKKTHPHRNFSESTARKLRDPYN